jgi:hypothetical protein
MACFTNNSPPLVSHAFCIPLVALLTSSPVMRCKEHILNFIGFKEYTFPILNYEWHIQKDAGNRTVVCSNVQKVEVKPSRYRHARAGGGGRYS